MQLPVYLDYMATTPVDPGVLTKMMACLGKEGHFGNPASQTHRYGWEAAELVSQARKQVASLINADPREIIWTSGATEANNLAIKGAANFYQRNGKHIITLLTEHKSVLDTCSFLESQGFEITYLPLQQNGLLDFNLLRDSIRKDTILVSIMHVNNETGMIQEVEAIAKEIKSRGIIFHMDAVQSAGKVAVDVEKIPADLISLSGHKLYGPKGIGALYVRRNPKVRLIPLIHGGGHEFGLRSGTLATHQIVGMGEAYAIAKSRLESDFIHCKKLTDFLYQRFTQLGGVTLNGDFSHKTSNCLNICFQGIDNDTLLASLPEVAASGGSACNSASHQASHVLLGMGLSRDWAEQAIRISVGRFTTMEEVEFVGNRIVEQVKNLRKHSLSKNS